jgi:hypothetical protein
MTKIALCKIKNSEKKKKKKREQYIYIYIKDPRSSHGLV